MSTNIIDRGEESSRKSNHRKAEEAKKEKKEQPKLDAAAARRARAKEDLKSLDPLEPCPINHCNQCGQILDNETAQCTHVKAKHPHCTFKCKTQGCGCFYPSGAVLNVHKSRH